MALELFWRNEGQVGAVIGVIFSWRGVAVRVMLTKIDPQKRAQRQYER